MSKPERLDIGKISKGNFSTTAGLFGGIPSPPPTNWRHILAKREIPRLRVDNNQARNTVGKAPQKPILLLALIVLNKNNRIDLSNIKPDLYLRETWEDLWISLNYPKAGPIHLPMYHLKSDGFLKIESSDKIERFGKYRGIFQEFGRSI